MPSPSEHMLKARDALLRQRQEIDRSIAELDKLIARWDPTASPESRGPKVQSGTARAAILEELNADPSPWPVKRILDALHARPETANLSEPSLRSVLNKMRERKEITNPSRGHYQIAVEPAHSAADDNGSEAGTESTPVAHPAS